MEGSSSLLLSLPTFQVGFIKTLTLFNLNLLSHLKYMIWKSSEWVTFYSFWKKQIWRYSVSRFYQLQGLFLSNNSFFFIKVKMKCDNHVGKVENSPGTEYPCPSLCEGVEAGNLTVCSDTQFKCSTNQCIPSQWRCDYYRNCPDGSDEVGCPG